MTPQIWALLATVIGSAVGATWILARKLTDIQVAILEHVVDDAKQFANLTARVSNLEAFRRRRGKS